MLISRIPRLVLVALVLLLVCQADSVRRKNRRKTKVNVFPKVVGGTPAPKGRFPYICSLRRRGVREHICGGTLIGRQWVLTAAHCVDPEFDGSTGLSALIYCGIYERDERNSSKVFAADDTFIHPKWSGEVTDGFDIALIKLDEPYDSPLPDLEARNNVHRSGAVFAALGWGQNSRGVFTDQLQIATQLGFVAKNICNRNNYWGGQINDSMICAGTGVQDTARGDSGGPLLQLDIPDGSYTLGEPSDDLLVGITSFGGESERGSFMPGVYTSVSYFRDWIDCVIEEKENCSNDGQGTPETAPGALVEGSEGSAEEDGVPLDPCPEVKSRRNFSQTIELINARTAIYEDDSDTLQKVLCAGLSPKTKFSLSGSAVNWTLLHVAAKYNAIKSARVLLGSGAEIEEPDKYGNRSLHIAARYNSVRVAKLLIKSGADVDSLSDNDWQPLHVAAFYDCKDVAELLIDSEAYVDSRSSDASTALHLAAAGNALGAAKLFLDKGANIESGDRLNETPLHRAADVNAPEVAKVLIDAGADMSTKDDDGDTPLHDATGWGSLEVVELLVYNGADVNAKGYNGLTPLHVAASRGRIDVAKFLVNNGASLTERNNAGYTPYSAICGDRRAACSSEDRERLRILLRA